MNTFSPSICRSGILILVLACSWACSPNRPQNGPEGPVEQFQIQPVLPVEELRSRAMKAEPPVEDSDFLEPDLVEISSLDPTIQLDIRYAGTNNFLGTAFYRYPRAYLQRPAAEALVRVNRELKDLGLGLIVYDAYRPWSVTKMFWDATPSDKKDFVADPAKGSRHNRGAAVDLSLYALKTGKPLPMPSGYDEFTERAHPSFQGGTEQERNNRALLISQMEKHGFSVYQYEWWHFDYKDWNKYPILNLSFDELD